MIEFQHQIISQLKVMNDNQERYGYALEEQVTKMNYLLEKLIDKLDEVKTQPIKKDKNV